MKKFLLSLILCIFGSTIFSGEFVKKFSGIENFYGTSLFISGSSIREIKILEISEDKTKIKALLLYTVTPYTQFVEEEINLILKKDKYEFSFLDGWNNKIFGWFRFDDDKAELYLNCKKYDKNGKNVARLYSNTPMILYDTSKDLDFFDKAIKADKEIKQLLNKQNPVYFPCEKEDTLLSIFYVGTIKDIQIYKSEFFWDIHSSGRETHRLVFIKNEKYIGEFYGIASSKIRVKDNLIIFEDIEKNNVIEIKDKVPEKVYIDGDVYIFDF